MPPTLRIEMGLSPNDGLPHSSSIRVFVGAEQIGLITNIRFSGELDQAIPQIEIDLVPEDILTLPHLREARTKYQTLLQPFMPLRPPPPPPEAPRPVCPTAWKRLNRDD